MYNIQCHLYMLFKVTVEDSPCCGTLSCILGFQEIFKSLSIYFEYSTFFPDFFLISIAP